MMDQLPLIAMAHNPQPAVDVLPSRLGLLLRVRVRLVRNRLHQMFHEQPLKLLGSIGSILLIWAGLYVLLVYTFKQVQRPVLEGIVATPLIFTFFFLALTGMLAFSSAILSYGALFRRAESIYLLTSPVPPHDLVIVNYLESLILSSWSLVLLGFPLMMAIARVFDESWHFYPLFLSIFVLFIPMPASLGLLLAWAAAMVFPRTPKRMIAVVVTPLVLLAIWWVAGLYQVPPDSVQWLKGFYQRASLVQNAMLPHTWVSKGINCAVQGQPGAAGFYLFVTFANALFASFVAVTVVARGFLPAFARGQSFGGSGVRRQRRVSTWVAELLFVYMPLRQRLLATKDLKSFLRDPLQWSQMAILFVLLALYVSNVRRLWTDLSDPRLQTLIAFLNLTAVSLILATFTNRFLYPLVSLDGQHLWLLGLLPLPRSRLIIAKFQYALTITLAAALAVMGVSVWRLELPRPMVLAHMVATAAICVGLSGVSIGMGARFPLFTERNPARIAGGFGGTASLLISVALVVASLLGMGFMSWKAAEHGGGDSLSGEMLLYLGGVVAVNVVAAGAALAVGIRHFNRIEC